MRSSLRPRLVTNNILMTYSSALSLLSIREEPFRATLKRTKLHQEFTILPYNTCTRSYTLLSFASNNECLTLTLSLRVLVEMWHALADLGSVCTKRQRQRCHNSVMSDDASNSVLIENNGVTPEWGCNPFSSDFIVFNDNRITRVITRVVADASCKRALKGAQGHSPLCPNCF